MKVKMRGASFTLEFPLQRTGSLGSVRSVNTIRAFGFEPLAFSYLALPANYRSKLDFTADTMHAATSGLARLRRAAAAGEDSPVVLTAGPIADVRARFIEAIADDLATPRAQAIAHEAASSADLVRLNDHAETRRIDVKDGGNRLARHRLSLANSKDYGMHAAGIRDLHNPVIPKSEQVGVIRRTATTTHGAPAPVAGGVRQ